MNSRSAVTVNRRAQEVAVGCQSIAATTRVRHQIRQMSLWRISPMRSLVIAVLLAARLFGQSQDPERQNIPALLSEVHQLRLAIERSTLLGTRMQISLQRIQMQEVRTARLSQDLDRLRKESS